MHLCRCGSSFVGGGLTEVPDVINEFVSLWAPRWQKHGGMDASRWHRVLDFARAFMPRFQLSLPAITAEVWMQAVKRYKPKAARGPDGWAWLDLLHMPAAYLDQLLCLLARLEAGLEEWPEQLLAGFVISLWEVMPRGTDPLSCSLCCIARGPG